MIEEKNNIVQTFNLKQRPQKTHFFLLLIASNRMSNKKRFMMMTGSLLDLCYF